jgi:hypothetical protein
MSCPCGLSREEVFELDKRDRVPIHEGCCQNRFLVNGSKQICGMPIGAHPAQQGKIVSSLN